MSVIEMRVPTIGESVTEVTLSQWLKPNGSIVQLDEPICEFESDKATLEFPAEASGKLEWVAAEGDDLEIGALVARIDTSAAAAEAPAKDTPADAADTGRKEKDSAEAQPAAQAEAPDKTGHAAGHPSPAAAKILREKGVDPQDVEGTGKDGRITKADAMAAEADKGSSKTSSPPTTDSTESSADAIAGTRNERREKMSRMRRTIAKRLVSAKNSTAMLTTFNEVDMSAVMDLRKQFQDQFVDTYGIKLGFMSLFAKACAQALMEMPDVNAHIDGEEIIYHDFVDISIAISTPTGLVVPPIRNVESMHFADIEKKIKELSTKARDGKLSLEEMTGGTFTITNGGIFGSLMSTPILNEPQSAILGMHAIKERPVVVNGEIAIRPMMYLALSYDHRIIDGSTSVTFLVKVKELLEDPVRMLLKV